MGVGPYGEPVAVTGLLDIAVPRTLRLDLQYDGSGFVGWQVQARGRTVQGELQRALRTLLQEDVSPVGSGRTDAGTHAIGQVAHISTNSALPVERILAGVNALLPPDMAASAVLAVPHDFHARYSARGKRYRYRITTAPSPLDRHRVWRVFRPLDMEAMSVAAERLTGVLDFRAFCKALPPPDNFECRIDDARWRREGRELVFEVEANRFLRHMVRILVGSFVEVGLGKMSCDAFGRLLSPTAARAQGGQTAPSRGLCLLYVNYDDACGGPSGDGSP